MINKVKSYLVFAPFSYRIVMYLVMPVVLVGAGILGRNVIRGGSLLIITWFLTLAEVTADNWIFGGIQSKDADKLDYLKTSSRGMRLMQNALTVDLCRKFLSGTVILTVCRLTAVSPQERAAFSGAGIHLCLLMLFYTATVLACLLARYCGEIWINLMIGHIAGVLEIFFCLLPGLAEYASGYAAFFGVCGILVSILAVKAAMKKVEGSYYDR